MRATRWQWMRPWGLAVLSLFSTTLGCEARVSLGATCAYHSECGALRCLYGRCRAECLTNIDCGGALVCNAGVCAEPTESCSVDAPCAAPDRACAGTICAERCTAEGTCQTGSSCEMRVGGLVCIPTLSTPFDAGLDASAVDDVGALDAAIADDAFATPDAFVSPDASAPPGSIRDLCVGRYVVCVARGDGSVGCWGVGHAGELGGGRALVSGDPGTIDCAPLGALGSVCSLDPVTVVTDDMGTPLADVDRLYCGERTTLALTRDGALYSWGLGSSGQLGRAYPPIGSGDAIARPVTDRAAVPLVGVRGATLGSQHGCAWLADGTTRCWGARYSTQGGQLGTGASDPPYMEGAILASVLAEPSSAIAVTDLGTCVVSGGLVRCFGTNEAGAMGALDAVDTAVRMPGAIMGLPAGATSLVSGPQFVCAHVGTDAYCWGQAGEGSLGRMDVSTYPTTRCPDGATYCDPRAEIVAGLLTFDALAGGTASTTVCGVVAGQVRCWGSSEYGTAGLAPGGGLSRYETPGRAVALEAGGALSDVRLVRLGGASACAITRDDSLYCWGANIAGHRRTTPDDEVHAAAVRVPLD